MKYFAFISYRHCKPDSEISSLLLKHLESYRIPKELRRSPGERRIGKALLDPASSGEAGLGKAFRDLEELPIDASLTNQIEAALDQSEFLIVICSPNATKSRFIRDEIAYFQKHHDPSKCLAVLAGGEPSSNRPEDQPFPAGLVSNSADGPATEPLAADVRAKSAWGRRRKLKKAKLKLVAAILGCDYDRLAEREKARQTRIRLWAATISAILMLIVGSVIFLYYHQAEVAKQDRQDSISALMYRYASENLDADPNCALCYDLEAILQAPRDAFFVNQQISTLLQSHKWPYFQDSVSGRALNGVLIAYDSDAEKEGLEGAVKISRSLDMAAIQAVSEDCGRLLVRDPAACRVYSFSGERVGEIPAAYAFLRTSADHVAWLFYGEGKIGVFRAADGLWVEVDPPFPLENGVLGGYAEIAADGKQLYLRNSGQVFRYDWDTEGKRYVQKASINTGDIFLEPVIEGSHNLWMDAKGRMLFLNNGNRIYVLKAKNFEFLTAIRQDNYAVSDILVSPSGRQFALAYGFTQRYSPSLSGNGRLELYSSLTGECLATTPDGSTQGVKGICFSADGKSLISWYYNGDVRIFDVSKDALDERCRPAILTDAPESAFLSAGEARLAVESERGTLDLYGLLVPASGKVAELEGVEPSLCRAKDGYAAVSYDRIMLFDQGWKLLRILYENSDGYAALRQMLLSEKARQPSPREYPIAFRYGDDVRAAVGPSAVSLYDGSGALAQEVRLNGDTASLSTVSDAIFSNDGRMLYVVGSNPESFIAAYSIDEKNLKIELEFQDRPKQLIPQRVCKNQDDSNIAVTTSDGRILVYRCGETISRYATLRTADQFEVRQMEFDPDSRLIALSLAQKPTAEDQLASPGLGAVELWDLQTGLMVYRCDQEKCSFQGMLFDKNQFYYTQDSEIYRLFLARSNMTRARVEALRLLSGYRLGDGMDMERTASKGVAEALETLNDEWSAMYEMNGSTKEGDCET